MNTNFQIRKCCRKILLNKPRQPYTFKDYDDYFDYHYVYTERNGNVVRDDEDDESSGSLVIVYNRWIVDTFRVTENENVWEFDVTHRVYAVKGKPTKFYLQEDYTSDFVNYVHSIADIDFKNESVECVKGIIEKASGYCPAINKTERIKRFISVLKKSQKKLSFFKDIDIEVAVVVAATGFNSSDLYVNAGGGGRWSYTYNKKAGEIVLEWNCDRLSRFAKVNPFLWCRGNDMINLLGFSAPKEFDGFTKYSCGDVSRYRKFVQNEDGIFAEVYEDENDGTDSDEHKREAE